MRCTTVVADVADLMAISLAMNGILQRHGRIDVLVNCAGGQPPRAQRWLRGSMGVSSSQAPNPAGSPPSPRPIGTALGLLTAQPARYLGSARLVVTLGGSVGAGRQTTGRQWGSTNRVWRSIGTPGHQPGVVTCGVEYGVRVTLPLRGASVGSLSIINWVPIGVEGNMRIGFWQEPGRMIA